MAKPSSNQKDKNISTLLTPCRPVGLRRKRTSPSDIHSPLLKALSIDTTTSPVSSVTSESFKRCPHEDNVEQEDMERSKKSSSEHELKNEDNKSIKRKSFSLLENSAVKKKSVPRNILKVRASPQHDTPIEGSTSLCEKSKDSTEKSGMARMSTIKNVDFDSKESPGCSTKSEINCSEEPIHINKISIKDVEALKERIAQKEKKLKELELAALYKKKHDSSQVAAEIDCWLEACKEALNDLQLELARRGQVYSLTGLLATLGIPSSLIGINEDE